jgi:hypothetical protein
LASLRNRLAELQSLNADRQRRAEQLQEQVAAANVGRQDTAAVCDVVEQLLA